MKTVGTRSFAYGWVLQIQVALMFFLFAALTNDIFNIMPAVFVEMYGWNYSATINVATIAGYAGVVGTFVASVLVTKKGNRFAIVFSLLGAGIFSLLFGRTGSFAVYLIICCCIFFFAFQFGAILTGTLTANWFPRKKGIVLGISSAGMCLSTCLTPPIFNALMGKVGIANTLSCFGVACIVLGIVSIFWVKNTPEEIGLAPDGDTSGMEDLERTQKEMLEYKSPWTISRLLKTPVVWTQSISYGLIFMVTIGVLGQWIPRMMELGMTLEAAMFQLSVASAIGILGSFIWGALDTKIGTRKTSILFIIWYVVAVIIITFGINNTALTWVGIIMVGSSVGGIGNLGPSMLITTFGRWDYAAASRVVSCITNLLRVSAFAVVAFGLSFLGSITGAYYILIGCGIVALVLMILTKDKLIGKPG
ncbi:MAG: MFS transporter [Oscillospiraceae bacterium]|nr:MFS transporter [Oscillospiraceae bacterium]